MSSSEIIAELPGLTHEERRVICQKIVALEAEQEDLDSCRQAAIAGFQLLDQMEAADEERHTTALKCNQWEIIAYSKIA
jgi:hypothetical protein